MTSSDSDTISVTAPADFHVHLRQGTLSELVTSHVRLGGFTLAYVMPNLQPPIKNAEEALLYKAQLQAIDPTVEYLMTLYLSPELTPDEIRRAKRVGIVGVNHILEELPPIPMEASNPTRPITPSSAPWKKKISSSTCTARSLHALRPLFQYRVLNAEPSFLPHLVKLHAAFPKLRIVLEHATTRAAVECVKSLEDTVACTITAHHLALTVDDWAGQSWNFCKPVAKFPDDRQALRDVIREGHPRFFLGSDSAPHPPSKKSISTPSQPCAAGVYTSPILLPLVAHLLESFGAIDKLENFVSGYGRAFYQRPAHNDRKTVIKRVIGKKVEAKWSKGSEDVVPFWAGREIGWEIVQDV